MFSIFNYTTLKVTLNKATRTLWVELNRNENNNAINLEMLFEIESLFAWVSNKVEIHSILISSTSDNFSCGLDQGLLPKLSMQQIEKVNQKLQKLVQAMFLLPQTIIVDLKNGCSNIASELAVGADLRLANVNAKISFDHAKLGLVPGAGGMAVLCEIVGPAMAKNLLLSGKSFAVTPLVHCGFIFDVYDSTNRDETIQSLLTSIHAQAPVQRIQSKLGIHEPSRDNLEKAMKSDAQIAKAALMTNDWKSVQSEDFMPAKSMSYSVKLSLVNNPEIQN
jgi:enoyl-CoA hydratase/carnithine racemase